VVTAVGSGTLHQQATTMAKHGSAPTLYFEGQGRPESKKSGAHVGRCPECDLHLAEFDKDTKLRKYVCPRCYEQFTKSQLK